MRKTPALLLLSTGNANCCTDKLFPQYSAMV